MESKEEHALVTRFSAEAKEEAKEEANPFELPPDDQVFLLRERERRSKQDRRDKLKSMTVWEKTQESLKNKGVSRRVLDAGELSADGAMVPKPRGSVALHRASISSDRRREKENMTDFIAKKREMFLVQMSLDTKREEIRKLEEKAQLKEEALRKSELMLEEDAIRFDTFLKENDKKAHEAIKRAETETKLKQDKVQEIKKLNHQIQAVQSDMSKLKEQLEDCLKYKHFLDELTPSEWFEEQRRIQRSRYRRARRAYKAVKLREYAEERARIMEDYEQLRAKEELHGGNRRGNRKDNAGIPPPKLPEPPKFDFSDDEDDDDDEESASAAGAHEDAESRRESKLADGSDEGSVADGDTRSESKEADKDFDRLMIEEQLAAEFEAMQLAGKSTREEEMPMYFEDPMQLLNIFTQLEESNLFLIQNSQETEQALEELKQEFRDTRQKMDVKTDSLKNNIDELRQQIDSEVCKASLLKNRMDSNMGEDMQEKLLRELNDKVKEVYRKCGFDCDASPSTLSMLTDLEARLEDLLSHIDQMPEEYVVKAEKHKEKERRERVRAERLAQQQQVYEERLRKSIERSMQAPKKKTGKPVMFRSAPPQKKVRKKDDSAAEEKAQDLKEFFSW